MNGVDQEPVALSGYVESDSAQKLRLSTARHECSTL
jgi:hypothetical protein